MYKQNTAKPLPWFFIGEKLTTDRIELFRENKHNLLSQSLGKQDTLSIWYSREHIAMLLDEIDHAGGDGLRVYLGMYENSHSSFPGQLCLLMATTRAVQIGDRIIHEKVDLEKESDFSQRSTLPKDLNLSDKRDFNFGSPCPPLCDY
jgi:hypothetical protein